VRDEGNPRDWRAEVDRRLTPLSLSARRRREIADELTAHLEDRYRSRRAAGAAPEEAAAAALRELDAPGVLERQVHYAEQAGWRDPAATRHQGARLMRRLVNDFRYGLRALRGARGATLLAVLAFALGIGITTAVFSVFYGVLLKPLPYPNADRLVTVYDVQPACGTCPASYPKFVDWRTRNTVFTEVAGTSNRNGVVTGSGDAERISLQAATWTVPAVFGVPPMMGRWFTEEEDVPGGDKVIVLGYDYWRDRFGASSSAIGQSITIDGNPWRVIGVMPRDYQSTIQVFAPLQRAVDPSQRGNHFLPTYARLKPGVSVAEAQQAMVALGATLAKEFGHNHGIDVQSYPERVLGTIRQPLRMLMGAVTLVLLIACANIANLLLASGTSRRREFAVRAALGATRFDLARQMLVESVALALAGGVLGLGLAYAAVQSFVVMGDTVVPRAATVSIDTTVLVFALALSVATGLFCALWPVVRLDARRLAASVREGGARGATDPVSRRFGAGLVVAEIALAFSLLVGAGLLVKDLLQLERRDVGFDAGGVVTFDLPLTGPRYADNDAITGFYDQLLPALASMPSVAHAAATRNLPMYNAGWNGEVQIAGGNPWPADTAPLVEQAPVTPDYFAAMGMPIRAGRAFDDRDRNGAELVTVLTRSTAEKFWPGQDPIGRRVSPGGPNNFHTVIGVVDDVRAFGLQRTAPFTMYQPFAQQPFNTMTVVLRVAAGNPSDVVPDARGVVRRIDPSIPVARVQTLSSVVTRSVSQPRLISMLTAVFGVMAGALAVVGVYGVMAYNVRRDRRQYGIQLALGADPAHVRRLIVGRGLRLGLMGIVLGGSAAAGLTRYIASQLNDVKPGDPAVFAAAAALLLAAAVAACAWPAIQAARTDPMVALRID
jgi:putative ABC transport system permease protein